MENAMCQPSLNFKIKDTSTNFLCYDSADVQECPMKEKLKFMLSPYPSQELHENHLYLRLCD